MFSGGYEDLGDEVDEIIIPGNCFYHGLEEMLSGVEKKHHELAKIRDVHRKLYSQLYKYNSEVVEDVIVEEEIGRVKRKTADEKLIESVSMNKCNAILNSIMIVLGMQKNNSHIFPLVVEKVWRRNEKKNDYSMSNYEFSTNNNALIGEYVYFSGMEFKEILAQLNKSTFDDGIYIEDEKNMPLVRRFEIPLKIVSKARVVDKFNPEIVYYRLVLGKNEMYTVNVSMDQFYKVEVEQVAVFKMSITGNNLYVDEINLPIYGTSFVNKKRSISIPDWSYILEIIVELADLSSISADLAFFCGDCLEARIPREIEQVWRMKCPTLDTHNYEDIFYQARRNEYTGMKRQKEESEIKIDEKKSTKTELKELFMSLKKNAQMDETIEELSAEYQKYEDGWNSDSSEKIEKSKHNAYWYRLNPTFSRLKEIWTEVQENMLVNGLTNDLPLIYETFMINYLEKSKKSGFDVIFNSVRELKELFDTFRDFGEQLFKNIRVILKSSYFSVSESSEEEEEYYYFYLLDMHEEINKLKFDVDWLETFYNFLGEVVEDLFKGSYSNPLSFGQEEYEHKYDFFYDVEHLSLYIGAVIIQLISLSNTVFALYMRYFFTKGNSFATYLRVLENNSKLRYDIHRPDSSHSFRTVLRNWKELAFEKDVVSLGDELENEFSVEGIKMEAKIGYYGYEGTEAKAISEERIDEIRNELLGDFGKLDYDYSEIVSLGHNARLLPRGIEYEERLEYINEEYELMDTLEQKMEEDKDKEEEMNEDEKEDLQKRINVACLNYGREYLDLCRQNEVNKAVFERLLTEDNVIINEERKKAEDEFDNLTVEEKKEKIDEFDINTSIYHFEL